MKNISKLIKLIFTLGTSFLLSGVTYPAVAQEVDLEALCGKFPLNSRCQDHDKTASRADKTLLKTRQLDRELFCDQFPFNSRCEGKPLEVIKLNLDRSGEDNEWIRIERKDNIVRLLHTSKVKDEITSEIINGVAGFIPSPILPDLNKYDWEDHRIIGVSFKSDRCQTDSCIATGRSTLKIPKNTDIYQGTFTIQYQEEDLMRAISFKIPSDIKAEISKTVTISTLVEGSR